MISVEILDKSFAQKYWMTSQGYRSSRKIYMAYIILDVIIKKADKNYPLFYLSVFNFMKVQIFFCKLNNTYH